MAYVWPTAAAETTTSTGTTDLTLAGAISGGFFAFGDVMSDGDTFPALTYDASGNKEWGNLTYHSSGNYVSRDDIVGSTNGGSAVDFGAGTKTIKCLELGWSDQSAAAKLGLRALLGSTTVGEALFIAANAAAAQTAIGATATGKALIVAADAAAARTAAGSAAAGANADITSMSALVATSRRQGRLCPYENLKIIYATAATVTVTADAVTLFTAGGVAQRFTSLSVTPSMASSGAGGLDTGTEASATWYYIWAIGKSDGTVSTVFSASGSAPTLPSGYTFYGLLGAVYNDGSSDFVRMAQRGHVAECALTNVLAAGNQTDFTTVSLSATVPPNASAVVVDMNPFSFSGSNAIYGFVAPDGSTTTATYGEKRCFGLVDTNGVIFPGVRVVLTTAQQIKYRVAGSLARLGLEVVGWEY